MRLRRIFYSTRLNQFLYCFTIGSYFVILIYFVQIYKKQIQHIVSIRTHRTAREPQRQILEKRYGYNKLIDLNNFSFLINPQAPQLCSDCREILFIVPIHSSLPNYENRKAIRETFGKSTDCVKFLFFMGITDDDNMTENIRDESATYGDIVQGNFQDTYRNLTYKHVSVLKWVTHHCPQAKYVLKMDDDVVPNIEELYKVLKQHKWGESGVMACEKMAHRRVYRSRIKWACTKEEWPEEGEFPTYCNGPFIIYSADVVPNLLELAQKARYFWIDDIHITGVLAPKLGLNLTDIKPQWYLPPTMAVKLVKSSSSKDIKPWPFLYGPINMESPGDMYLLWNATQIAKTRLLCQD